MKMYLKHWISCNVWLVFCKLEVLSIFLLREKLKYQKRSDEAAKYKKVSSANTDDVKVGATAYIL